MINRYQSQEANLVAHIKTLRIVAFSCMAICFVLVLCIFWVAREHRLSLPPELRFGAKLLSESIEPHEIYLFAGSVYQQIYLWMEDGFEEFEKNIHRVRYLITDDFYKFLLDKHAQLEKHGELRGRKRNLQAANVYQPEFVTRQSRNEWLVQLNLILNESLNGIKIKDQVVIQEYLPVIYKDINSAYNPWGLLLDTPSRQPRRMPLQEIK